MTEPWTTDTIREAFIYDGGEAEYHDPEHGAQTQRRIAGAIFDAWLAAHDAQKRAEWEAESFECPNCLINESDATSREDWMFDQSSRWGLAAAESRARSADPKETP